MKKKLNILRRFMMLKIEKANIQDAIKKYNLTNSIVPAIQEYILLTLNIKSYQEQAILFNSVLSYQSVFNMLHNKACKNIKNWTVQLDRIDTQDIKKKY